MYRSHDTQAKCETKYASYLKPWKEKALAKVKGKITKIKQKIKAKQIKPVLSAPDVKKHQEELHRKFLIVTIDKASSNFLFICRKYYISKPLAEVSPIEIINSSSIYSQTTKSKEELIETNIKYCKKFDLKITEQDKTLSITYWVPQMHKKLIGGRFIVVSKNCSTKPLSDMISKVFFLTMLKVFIEKVYFTHHLNNSGLLKNRVKKIPRKKPKVFQPSTLSHCIR